MRYNGIGTFLWQKIERGCTRQGPDNGNLYSYEWDGNNGNEDVFLEGGKGKHTDHRPEAYDCTIRLSTVCASAGRMCWGVVVLLGSSWGGVYDLKAS